MSFRPVKPREYGDTKRVIAELFDQVGGVKEAAFLLDRGLSQTYGYADPTVADANISFHAVRSLTRHRAGATAAAEALAFDAGGCFMPFAASNETFAELLARGEEENGAMMASLVRRIDAARGGADDPKLVEHLDAVISALAAARAALKAPS